MPDIITPAVSVLKSIKTRAPYIAITNTEAPASDPFLGKSVDFNCSHVLKIDGESAGTVTTDGGRQLPTNVRRQIGAVAAEVVSITDPVTSNPVTISVAGVSLVLETLFAKWYQEDENAIAQAAAAAAAAAATP